MTAIPTKGVNKKYPENMIENNIGANIEIEREQRNKKMITQKNPYPDISCIPFATVPGLKMNTDIQCKFVLRLIITRSRSKTLRLFFPP